MHVTHFIVTVWNQALLPSFIALLSRSGTKLKIPAKYASANPAVLQDLNPNPPISPRVPLPARLRRQECLLLAVQPQHNYWTNKT